MKKINIFKDSIEGLGKFKDERGLIADIFYKTPLEHVAIIKSEPNVIRGNHYHKQTTQHMLMTQGSLEYWYKDINDVGSAKMILCKRGDLISTPPFEIHGLRITEKIVLSIGDMFCAEP